MTQTTQQQLLERIAQLEQLVSRRDAEVVLMQTLIEKLKLQIARFKRDKFGASSEKGGELAQMELLLEELETTQAQLNSAVSEASAPPRPARRPNVRKPLPEHLPRETLVHEGACGCPECGSADLVKIGEDVSEQLELVPERFKVIRVQEHLKDFCGILQADGYAGYEALYDTGLISEAACWAHARRKFHDLHELKASPMAAQALQQIAQLYAIEARIRGKPPDARQRVRQQETLPLLERFKVWMDSALAQTSTKSELARAIRYSLGRWQALTRYAVDGRIEMDNNAAEREIRAAALGRKNFLFIGSDAGGERAAAFYSLLGTAKLNGLDPEAYLHHVLQRIGDASGQPGGSVVAVECGG